MIGRIHEHLAAERNVFAYFKHEETPEGAIYAVEMLKEFSYHRGHRVRGGSPGIPLTTFRSVR